MRVWASTYHVTRAIQVNKLLLLLLLIIINLRPDQFEYGVENRLT